MRGLEIFRQVRVDHRARSGQFAFHVRVRGCVERSRVYDGRSALERVHHVVPLDRQEVRAEPRSAPASPTAAIHGQWNGECPATILLEPAALAIPNITMYNAAMYKRIRVR